MRRGNGLEGVWDRFGGFEDLDESRRLLNAFSAASVIGLSVCDDELRFLGVNDALAAMNGITPEAHVGKTVRDILKGAAAQPEPALQRVLTSGEAVCFELTATLPTRADAGYWIENYFPIKGRAGKVNQIATITVEVTAQRRLEKSFQQLTSELLWAGNQQYRLLAGALHDSINAYHAIITTSLSRLTTSLVSSEHGWEQESSAEILAQTVEWLDQRIVNMRTIVSDVASRFPERSAKPVLVM
jgi:transcriptional regulator with PAS, ATPase and Fis domain